MQFKNLTISNFCTVGDAELSLEGLGLVLVTGENKDAPMADSNGAGKSTLLDALAWCLWGQTVRGLKGDDVVNRFVGKDCKVKVTFESGGTQYTVSRYRKHTKSDKPNDLVLLADDIDCSGPAIGATQEVITNLVGVDFSTFCAMMPGAGVNVAQLTDKQIKDLLENILKTSVLSQAHFVTKEKRKELQREVTAQLQKQVNLSSQLDQLKERRTSYVAKETSFEDDKQRKLEDLMLEVNQHEKALKEQQTLVEQAEEAAASLATVETQLAQARSQFLTALGNYKDVQVTYKEYVDLSNKDLQEFAFREKTLEAAIAKVNKLGPSCDSCLQTVPDTHKNSKLEEYAEELKDVQVEKENFETDFREGETSYLDDLDAYAELKDLASEKEQALIDTKNKLLEASMGLPTQKKFCKQYQDLLDQTLVKVEELKASTSPFSDLIQQTSSIIDEAQEELKKLAIENTELSKQLRLHEFWEAGFSPQGLRSFMLSRVTPYLNARAHKYCEILTDGEMKISFHTKKALKSKKTDKDIFNIEVEQAHGGNSYTGCSEGERARANLVIALVLADLAALRSDSVLSFRFLDEPFDKIDELGTEAVVKVLNEHKEKYDTTFVITHKPSFKSMFNRSITMVKEGSVSSLEVDI